MQRRDDFDFATWLPRQHGTRPAPARTGERPDFPIPRRLRTNRRRTRRNEPRLYAEEAIPFLNQGRTAEVGRLPKRMMLYIDPGPWGHVAEWLRNGLQNQLSLSHWHLRKPYTAGISPVWCHKVPALTGT